MDVPLFERALEQQCNRRAAQSGWKYPLCERVLESADLPAYRQIGGCASVREGLELERPDSGVHDGWMYPLLEGYLSGDAGGFDAMLKTTARCA